MDSSLASPRLLQLRHDMEARKPEAIHEFWSEVQATGTPLVETDDTDPDARLVTFLWRETGPTENVVLVEWFSNYDRTLREKQMTRLGETDVWFKTLRIQSDISATYHFLPNDTFIKIDADPDIVSRFARMQLDPLNPLSVYPPEHAQPGLFAGSNASVFVSPDAPRLAIEDITTSAPVTPLIEETISSKALGYDKTIWIHAPARSLEPGVVSRLLIQTDGESVERDPLTLAMIEAALAPLITVLIKNTNRDVELPCNPDFADFVADELIPHMRSHYAIADGPAAVIMAGQSYGGLAAVWVALKRPDAVGNAFSQSGSFWWSPRSVADRSANLAIGATRESCWLPTWAAQEPKHQVRFWLEAGLLENAMGDGTSGLLGSNRYLRDVLTAKGYEVAYREFPGGHDHWSWRGIYLDGLTHLLKEEG